MEFWLALTVTGFGIWVLAACGQALRNIHKELVKHNALCEKAAGLQSDWHLYN